MCLLFIRLYISLHNICFGNNNNQAALFSRLRYQPHISGYRSWISIASSSDGNKLAASVIGGYIYTSIDSGVNWTEQTGSGSRDWSYIASSSDGTKLAVGVLPGYIYTSSDSGVTWTEQTNAGSTYWYYIASSSDGSKLAATVNNGYIYTNILASPTGYAVDGIDLNQIFQPLSSTSTTSPTGYTVTI